MFIARCVLGFVVDLGSGLGLLVWRCIFFEFGELCCGVSTGLGLGCFVI